MKAARLVCFLVGVVLFIVCMYQVASEPMPFRILYAIFALMMLVSLYREATDRRP